MSFHNLNTLNDVVLNGGNRISKPWRQSSRNTYIGNEETRGVSGGERRRVTIGVDIIHGPSLLFLDEPTSGLDSTSAHNVIEKVRDIARLGSTVVLTIHQPSSRIQLLLDRLIVLARGQLMYQGTLKDVGVHLGRMGRKVPKGENSIEFLIDVIQEYDQSDMGVEVLAEFVRTGMKPPPLDDDEMSVLTVLPSPSPGGVRRHRVDDGDVDFDRSLRSSQWNASRSWTPSRSGIAKTPRFTPSRRKTDQVRIGLSPMYSYSKDILSSTPTPGSSDYIVNENDYRTPITAGHDSHFYGPKFSNSFFTETWILTKRNFINIRRTPELFLSRLVVLTVMGIMMATMFFHPKKNMQGLTNRLSFFIFTVCLFFFSSNDAVPAFIQERFIFIRETSHNAYRASSYTISGLITYLPFLAIQAGVYSAIVWFPLKLRGSFPYFYITLFVSLLTTNSFVVFVSSVVPNYIIGYAAVIAFTALFFLFCGYFVSSHSMPGYWKWMNKVSTMTYPYEGLLMNEFQTGDGFGSNVGVEVSGFDVLEQLLRIDHKNDIKMWERVFVMLGWAVFYRILFYLVLRFASKNQRT